MLRLIKLQLNVGFGFSALKWYFRHNPKKFWGGMGIVLLVVLGIAPIFFLYTRLVESVYTATFMLGQSQVVLSMGMVLAAMLVFFFGIAYVLSAFYFSRDLPVLVPLPLQARDILAAKFSVVLMNNYLTITPFFLPALFVYGIRGGEGPLYWLMGVVVFLLLPVIPLTVATALILILMRATNLSKRKDTLRMIGMLAFIALVLGFNVIINQVAPGEEMEFVQRLLTDQQGLVFHITRIFPPAAWATLAMTAGGITALMYGGAFLAANILGVAAIFSLGNRIFYQGLIGGDELQSRKKLSLDALDKKISRASSPISAIALREIKILFRTPIYLFNSVGILILLPVIMLIPALSGGGLAPLLDLVRNQEARVLINLGGAAFMGTMALFAPASSSSFSREGRCFWISKVIPVPPQDQIKGKMVYSFLIVFLAIPLLVFFPFLTVRWSVAELFVVVAFGTLLAFPAITISLLVDMVRPFLDWDNPQRAIKQNVNVLVAMVAGAALFALIFFLTYRAYSGGFSDLWIYGAAGFSALVLGLVPYVIMMRLADKRYRDITVG